MTLPAKVPGMTGRAATPTHFHLRLRIPGWLLAAALLVPALFLGWKFAADQFDRADPEFGMPTRITVLERTVTEGGVSIRMLIETNDELHPLRLRYAVHVEHPDGSREALQAAGSIYRWEDRSIVVQVDRLLPAGAEFKWLDITGPSWGSGVDLTDPVHAPRSAVESWGESVAK